MPSYGFMMSQIRVHRIRQADAPLRLGSLLPPDDQGTGTAALKLMYGIMRGLSGLRVADSKGTKHFKVTSVEGIGQCVHFQFELGRSGQDSTITDPEAESGAEPFLRSQRHIETLAQPRRGLFILPANSTAGLLAIEAHGRSTGRDLLKTELKRAVRAVTEENLILDVDPVADVVALAEYLEQANINTINLRRYKLPKDVADQLEIDHEGDDAGSMQMMIEGRFKRGLLEKLRNNPDARKRLLVMQGIDFDELNVQLEANGRRLTMAVIGEHAPTIINVIGPTRPTDERFHEAVRATATEIALGLNVRLGDDNWATEPWSDEGRAFIIERSATEGASDDGESPDP